MKKFKTSFLINFLGLTTGLVCAFFIYLWINEELHFDKFHKNDKQLFQVMELSKENGEMIVHDGTQGMLAETMAKDLPEVELATPIMSLYEEGMRMDVGLENKSLKAYGSFVSKDFFEMFTFPILQGNKSQVFKDRNNVVVSKELAISLYGSPENAIGKRLGYEMFGNKKQASVSGVFATLPSNTSMKFDILLTHEILINEIWTNGQKWWNTGPSTYLQLKKGTDVAKFNKKIQHFLQKYNEGNIYSLFVRPYSGAYLHGNYENGKQVGGRIEYVKLFSVIAIIILVVACINFMNLSTARASRRLKEVGIKKAVGSSRRALVFQFLCEAMFMVLFSVLAACLIVAILLPYFNNLTGKQIELNINAELILMLLTATLVTGFVSGSYPAFYLSGFNPVVVLKGRPKNSISELLARKGLVVFQFTVSLLLIVSVIVVYQQMKFIQSKNLGYDRISMISFERSGGINKNTDVFLNELKQTPGVLRASTLESRLAQAGNGSSTYGISWPGKDEKQKIDFAVRSVDYGLIETLGIKMKDGRSFSSEFGSDSSSLIFNEAAIRVMGLKNPIGTPIRMWDNDMTIVGVVKDFHISSLHEAIVPLVFRYNPSHTSLVIAKIKPGKEKETLSSIETLYKKYNPGIPFEYSFLDDEYKAQYVSEERISVLAQYFAGLAVLIMCLGLFGLAAFNAEVRTKEIGIRKVLGATTGAVVLLLSKDFFKLVALSMLIAFPVGWWVMSKWLSGFVYKVNLGPGIFVVALVAILLITVFTISFQSIKAAVANPARSLKAE
ncbi:ABC transporter permease [Flavitalea sp.]|nr:ABC transporter permease [Flavitalea sp.]